MKRKIKKLLSLLVVTALVLTSTPIGYMSRLEVFNLNASAEGTLEKFKEGNFTYTVENGEATLVSVVPKLTTEIPETLGGYPVTKIGDKAFYEYDVMSSDYITVILPSTIKEIGNYAFAYAYIDHLELSPNIEIIGEGAFYKSELIGFYGYTINSMESLKSIGKFAFFECYDITSVYITESVEEIGDGAFAGCYDLETIEVDENNPYFTYEKDTSALLSKDGTVLIQMPNNGKFEYIGTSPMLQEVKEIRPYACYGAYIPYFPSSEKLEKIGEYAFAESDGMSDLYISEKLSYIGKNAFKNACVSDIEMWGENENFTVEDDVLFNHDKTVLILYGSRTDIEEIRDYTIPSTVTEIASGAFSRARNIGTLTIPATVKTIGESAFERTVNISDIVLEEGITEIPNSAFKNSRCVKNFVIPSTVITIGESAFENTAIKAIDIPDSVITIGDKAFSGCSSAKTISIGNSVETIGKLAFNGSAYNREVFTLNIPASVKSIGAGAFADVKKIGEFSVDEANEYYQSIDGMLYSKDGKTIIAANYSNSPETLLIPESVEEIAPYAFYNDISVLKITLPSTLKVIGEYAFCRIAALEEPVTIPESVEEIGAYAFAYSYCEYMIINSRNLKFDGTAMAYNNVKDIFFAGSEEEWNDALVGNWFGNDVKLHYNYIPITGVNIIETGITLDNTVGSVANAYQLNITVFPFNANKEDILWSSSNENIVTVENGYVKATGNGIGGVRITAKTPSGYTDTCQVDVLDYLGFSFEFKNNSATLVDCDASVSNTVIVPSEILGKPVIAIGDYAFQDCRGIDHLLISDTVTTIGKGAFLDCKMLEYISIPDSVTYISADAFNGCSNLEEFDTDANGTYVAHNDVLYKGGTSHLVRYPAGKTDYVYTVEDTVTRIGASAFEGASNLAVLKLHNNITIIEDNAFANCTKLETMLIPENISTIYSGTFTGCKSLKNIVLSDSVKKIDSFAFDGCTAFGDIYYTGTLEEFNAIMVDEYGNDAFKNAVVHCNYVPVEMIALSHEYVTLQPRKNFKISFSVTPTNANLTNYEWSSSNEKIAIMLNNGTIEAAYNKGTTVITLKFPGGAYAQCNVEVSDKYSAFQYVEDVETNTVQIIGPSDRNTAGTVVIPEKINELPVTSLSSKAFFFCPNIEKIELSSLLEDIGSSAFEGCANLNEITVNSLNEFYMSENGVLYNKEKTELIQYPPAKADVLFTLPAELTTIKTGAMSYCKNLTTLTIDKNVRTIEDGAFGTISSLKIVYYQGTEDEWNEIAIGQKNEALTNANIIFQYDPISKITLNATDITLKPGETFKLEVSMEPENALKDMLEFTTDTPSIATVDENGLITATGGDGWAQIQVKARDTGVIATCLVRVEIFKWYEDENGIVIDGLIDGLVINSSSQYYDEIIIPDMINGKPVYKLSQNAFSQVIPTMYLEIPATVTLIEDGAFSGLRAVEGIVVKADNKVYEDVEGDVYTKDGKKLVRYPAGRLNISYEIKKGTEEIAAKAFENSLILTNVTIPASVTKVGTDAFKGCENITDVYYMSDLEDWENIAFYGDNSPIFNANIHLISGEVIEGKISLSGVVTSSGDGDTVIKLYKDGDTAAKYVMNVTGSGEQSYKFNDIEAGTYTVKAFKQNHATRTYTVEVEKGNVGLDIEIHLNGDLDGDGIVNIRDLVKINSHLKEINVLADYELSCADVTGDGKVNMADLAKINAHIKEINTLW